MANPYGLLALLGIPAVLAIHFLQRKAIEIPVPGLFLLERTQRDAASGRRLERLIPSIPLWMQLLAVLLLTWFLAEPRFPKRGSVQRIAVVVDSSASMGVFKKEMLERLAAELPSFQGPATTMQLTVLESAPNRPRLYAGDSVKDLQAALEKWQPLEGIIDPTQAIRLARSLVSRDGTVIYLTDTPAESLPFDARLMAVGATIDNVGFTGVNFSSADGTLVWEALVRNYGKSAADRSWTLQSSRGVTAARPIHLEPGALVTLQAAFPQDATDVSLVLSGDRFTLDDTLPLVAPKPKTLTIFAATSPANSDLSQKLLRALDAAIATNDAASADLSIISYDPLDPVLPPGNSIVSVSDSTRAGAYLKGGIIAAPNPLMDHLNWQSLLVRETIELERSPSDTVLLWQDKRPLIFLRETPATKEHPASRQLCFNFDLHLSNAAQQPAFIVLLHRFAETIRDAKVAPASLMLDTNQPLKITAAPDAPLEVTARDLNGKPLPKGSASATHAPPVPGFLTARQNGKPLLDAAVFFADTREADFSLCGSSDADFGDRKSAIERHTKPDPLWRIWILILVAALIASWKFIADPLPA